MSIFKLKAPFEPSGDQPQAIAKLIAGIKEGDRFQTLVGVTGSGKTFTMANVIKEFDHPVLILSHNKTLAAQLYSEFKAFFPENAVEYFVSYYDYYQPEAYVPTIDLYIAKDADINQDIARLRHSTIRSLIERKDVIVVSSVSCIYGWDSPEEYREGLLTVTQGAAMKRDDIARSLIGLRYERVEDVGKGGSFRVRGSTLEVMPKETETGIRIRLSLDGTVEKIQEFDLGSRQVIREYKEFIFFPAAQFVTSPERIEKYIALIQKDMEDRVAAFTSLNKFVEAQRIEERTRNDVEMLREAGYCTGIENYSRYFSGRAPGSEPYTLLSFLPKDFLLFVDESHISVPQIRGMFNGDRQRKQTLIDYGFRLPSALDNRPLTFDEFMRYVQQAIFVSATPSDYEYQVSAQVAQQLLRPTGLVDPRHRSAPQQGPGPQPDRRDTTACREAGARAGHDADEEELGTAGGLPPAGRHQGAVPAQRPGRARPRAHPAAAALRATSTSWSASTFCAKAWTCRRSRWSPSWMRTRKGSCAARRPSCRPWAGPPATCPAPSSCTPTRSPAR